MITINLLPEDIRENIDFSRKNKKLIGHGKIVILLCFFTIVSFVICGAFLINSNQFFSKEISESSHIIDGYKPVIEQKKMVEENTKSIGKIRSGYEYFTKFNYILNQNTPEGVYLGTLETQDNTLKITGYAKAKNDIGIFRDALENADAFSNVNIESIKETDDPSNQAVTVNSFVIDANLESSATSKGGK